VGKFSQKSLKLELLLPHSLPHGDFPARNLLHIAIAAFTDLRINP
jgi:hypothetical protein